MPQLTKKNKIAIIADIPNWSFDIIAQLLKKELSHKYDIDVFYCVTDFNKDLFDILEATKEYDVIHFLARKLLLQFEDESNPFTKYTNTFQKWLGWMIDVDIVCPKQGKLYKQWDNVGERYNICTSKHTVVNASLYFCTGKNQFVCSVNEDFSSNCLFSHSNVFL